MARSPKSDGDDTPSLWVKALTLGGAVIKRLPPWSQFTIVFLVLVIIGAYFLLPLWKTGDSNVPGKATTISGNKGPVTTDNGIGFGNNYGPVNINYPPAPPPEQSKDTLREKSLVLPSSDNGGLIDRNRLQIEYLAPFTRVMMSRKMGSDHFAFMSAMCREVRYNRNASLH